MGKTQKDTVIKDIARYSSSMIFQRMLGIINTFIKPRFLSPELYGLWHMLDIIRSYTVFAHLGSRSSMRYIIPYNEAKHEYEKNREVKGSVFFGSLFLNIIIAVGLIVYSLRESLSTELKLGLLTMASLAVLQWYYEYHLSLLKSYQNFKLISSSNYIKATVSCLFSIILIYFFNIYGIYISILSSYIAVILYIRLRHPLEKHSTFKFSVFKNMVRDGFPIMIFSFANVLIRSSDKIIISSLLGTKYLGFYGLAFTVFGFVRQIPGAARDVIEPKLMQEIDTAGNEKIFNEYLMKPLTNTAYFMPFLTVPIFFLLPVLIPLFFPRYIQGILPAQILVFLGSYFLSLTYVMRGIIVANKWQSKASVITIAVLIINISVSTTLVKLNFGIAGVAFGSSVSFSILFFTLLLFVRNKYNQVSPNIDKSIAGLFLPFIIICVAMVSLTFVSEHFLENNYIAVCVKILCFYLIMILVVHAAGKKNILIKKIELNKIWKRV